MSGRGEALSRLELSAGTIEYRDTGGEGRVLVLLHGVLMDGGQWREVLPHLTPEYRCILPTLPLGAHRLPMKPEADLSLAGQARLLAEFVETLDLQDATLVFNDWAAPQLLIAEGLTARISARAARSAAATCRGDRCAHELDGRWMSPRRQARTATQRAERR